MSKKTRRQIFLAAVFCFMIILPLSSVSRADLYKYSDKGGAVVITDKYDSIPQQYRKNLTVIRDTKPQVAPEPKSAPAVAERATPDTQPTEPWHRKYQPLAITALALVAFYLFIRKLASTVGGDRIGTLIFLVVVLGAGVYLYRTYLEDFSSIFQTLRQDTLNVKKSVENRETKTEKALQSQEPSHGPAGR